MTGPRSVVVAGMGHPLRRDDGVGPLVADRVAAACGAVRRTPPVADPLDLFGWWDGADLAVVVDASRSGAAAGTVASVELLSPATGAGPAPGDPGPGDPGPRRSGLSRSGPGDPVSGDGSPGASGEGRQPGRAVTSTHGFGLVDALLLARALGRAPHRVVVVSVEGTDFSWGEGLSPAVAAAVPGATARVLALVEGAAPCA